MNTMGLGVALIGGTGGISLITILYILISSNSQIYELNSSRSQSSELDAILIHTNFDFGSLYAQSGSDRISFTLQNTGGEKLWNYDKFTIIATYNASIAGVPTLTSESLSYNSAQSFMGGEVGAVALSMLDLTKILQKTTGMMQLAVTTTISYMMKPTSLPEMMPTM